MPTFGVVERQQLGLFRLTNCLASSMQSSAQPLEPLMKFVRRSILVFALALTVARCADQPTAVKAPAGPQFLRWAETPQFSARTTDPRARRSGAMALTPPLSLEQYAVSFWAVRGESRSVQINYRSSIDNNVHPFLQLKIWYDGAGGDLNGDGVADSTDAAIEAQVLGLWYREKDSDPWTKLGASQSLDEKSFTYALPHFCEYDVAEALMEWAVNY